MTVSVANKLEQEIEDARRTISSDGYPMSIGEVTNLYRDGELKIRPEFQRLFRWSPTQKSRLVESLILGIPLPSIFVAQNEDGKWELIDGLQRVSTILQLQGELIDHENRKVPPLTLVGTKYLPALEGRVWQSDDPATSLSEAQRLDIKRTKIDVKIIKRESSPKTKYDLFQRLNSYGSALTAQEMRSALLVAVSPDFFSWLESLAKLPSFLASVQLPERLLEERFDLELVIRFLLLHARPESGITVSVLRDFTQLLDDESVAMAMEYPRNCKEAGRIFAETFDFIFQQGGDKVFRRWDPAAKEFKGPFLSTAFEVFALGIGYHKAKNTRHTENLLEVVKDFWRRPEMAGGFATGRSTERRLADFVPLGRAITASK